MHVDQILPDERLAAGQPNRVQPWKLREDAIDLVERELALAFLAPRVAHHAAGVAPERDDEREQAWQVRPVQARAGDRGRQLRPAPHHRDRRADTVDDAGADLAGERSRLQAHWALVSAGGRAGEAGMRAASSGVQGATGPPGTNRSMAATAS